MSRIIMGIDPGTTVTGYGLIQCEGKQMSLLACGALNLGRASDEHPEKLKRIFERLYGLIQEFKPQEMALEAPFFGKNPQSMLKLGRAQGVAMAAGLMNGMEIYEYAPRKVKTAVTGSGASSKEQVAQMLRRLLQFEEQPAYLDATDALAVAVCHFYQHKALAAPAGPRNWAAYLRDNPDKVKKRPPQGS
ncbi:MAG: crossover junction endodeoxyribonuclease RuvC [Bacteroidia bacterium]|nr:crossover junction endodeoxyribonuclease RuvC [Bacteroidia bacterium]